MNRKWRVMFSLLILSLIFPLRANGVSRYFTFNLPIEFGTTKNVTIKIPDSLDIKKSSISEDSISSEVIEKEAITINRSIEAKSNSSERTNVDENEPNQEQAQDESHGQVDNALQSNGEQ